MENIQKMMYVGLYTVIFMVAVAFTISLLKTTQAKESVVLEDAADKASITQQDAEKDDKTYVPISAQEVFSTILAVADSGEQVNVYIESSMIAGGDMTKIKERKENVLQTLRQKIGSGYYRRINRFNSDLDVTEIHFEGVVYHG